MMPERDETVHERNEQVPPQSEYPRTEQPASERARWDGMRPEQMRPEQVRPDGTRSGGMRSEDAGSGQTRTEQSPTGQQAAEPGSAHPADEQRERLVPEDRAASYGSRWDAVTGTFVDEPRGAVAQADALVGELLDELENLFREQLRSIERVLDSDETSTEDLRRALRRHRSFFQRLLAV